MNENEENEVEEQNPNTITSSVQPEENQPAIDPTQLLNSYNPEEEEEIEDSQKKGESGGKFNIDVVSHDMGNKISSLSAKIDEDDVQPIYIEKTSEIKGKTVYHLKGPYFKSPNAEIVRRYKDFNTLHNKLKQRWPAVYIPPIPKKQLKGNMDEKTINKRVFLLNSFLKELSKLPYIMETEEVKGFLSEEIDDSAKVQSLLSKIPAHVSSEIRDKYKNAFSDLTAKKKKNFTEEQMTYTFDYINKFNTILLDYKSKMDEFCDKKRAAMTNASGLIQNFEDLEKHSVIDFVGGDMSKLFFFNGENAALTQAIINYKNDIKNPYQILSDWIRLKELELFELRMTLNDYKDLQNRRKSLENEKKDLETKIENLKNGKKGFLATITMKDPTKLKEKYIKDLDVKISELTNVSESLEFLNIYHSVFVYDFFNKLKQSIYVLIKNFAIVQHKNCITNFELWLKVNAQKEEKKEEKNEEKREE